MTSRRRLLPASIVAAALSVAACGGSSDGGATDTAVTPVATEPAPVATEPAPVETEPAPAATEPAPVETEPAPVATEPAPAEPEPAPDDEPGGADPSCLVGEWIVTEDELNAYYDALEASFDAGTPALSFDVVGNVLLTFTETDYTYAADFDLTLDVAGQTGTGDTMGTVSGTWDVVDGLVVTTLGSSDLNVVVTIAGVTLGGSDLANGLLDSAPINNAQFDCAGPTISFQTADADGLRHDVLLTPA